MFTALYNWWNKDKIAMQLQLAELLADKKKQEETDRLLSEQKAAAELQAHEDAVCAAAEQKAAEELKRITPWVEIKSADYDVVKGFRIELDWNQAFVEQLRDGGIQGRDDDAIVQKWIAMLYQDLAEELEQKVVDSTAGKAHDDFE